MTTLPLDSFSFRCLFVLLWDFLPASHSLRTHVGHFRWNKTTFALGTFSLPRYISPTAHMDVGHIRAHWYGPSSISCHLPLSGLPQTLYHQALPNCIPALAYAVADYHHLSHLTPTDTM